jgi:hypothetical protein
MPEIPTMPEFSVMPDVEQIVREVVREELARFCDSPDAEAADEEPLYGSDGVKRSPGF